ncbi:MAG: inositol monophosphatase family protein [Thiotrichaceae bacterium]
MHPMLNTAVTAARKAGDIISRYSDRVDQLDVQEKEQSDFVSQVDKMAEEAIIDTIKYAYRDHAILAEESGKHEGDSSFEWIIDPLDGTTNYLYGIPQYAVSIALTRDKKLYQSVIYNPANGDLFTASRGQGAMLNNKRLRVTPRRSIENALLVTGIPYKANQDMDLYLETLKALVPDTAGIRRPGSAALDLAYVAAGRYDGFWEFGLNQWDIAAGVLLVQEAGGLVSDMFGGDKHMESGDIVAASPKVFRDMHKRIHPVVKKSLK